MFSLIVSIKDESKYNSILAPSLDGLHKYLFDGGLPPIQIIKVSGDESLGKNYNDGIAQSIWETKFFIHEDVDIQDSEIPLFVRVDALFKLFPKTGLVGLVGTMENPSDFWWNCKKESIVGHVQCNEQYWMWNKDKPYYDDIQVIDGMFMATNKDIFFSEDIKGFHFYDSDYSNVIRKCGYEIKVLPHKVYHKASTKDLSTVNASYYNKKWGLNV